ncbi:hypothetical protein DdX_18728 [Ditylenchus destructor]|uniref:Uncharacterized protein n=1 Tax=Ditylenchus destructor TaxID=166010 RepID=A0AAD4QY09_9BILA|nr:hypothetical protein DdX_18728 [Ditylenchus destructor]
MTSSRRSVRLANARIQQEINNLVLLGDGIQRPITRAITNSIWYNAPVYQGTRKRRATSLDTTLETVNYREKAVQRRRACQVPAKRPSPRMCQVANPPKRGRGRPPKAQSNTNKDRSETLRGWTKRATFEDARDMTLVLKHHMMQEAEIYADDQLPVVSGTNLKLYTCILADSHQCPFEMFSVQRRNEVTKFELYRSTKHRHNHANFNEAPVNSFGGSAEVLLSIPRWKLSITEKKPFKDEEHAKFLLRDRVRECVKLRIRPKEEEVVRRRLNRIQTGNLLIKDRSETLRDWTKRATFENARDMTLVLKHHMMQEAEIYADDQLPVFSGTNLKLYTCILADSHQCPFEMFSVQRRNEVTKFELYRSTKHRHNHANFNEAPVNSFGEMNNSGENDSSRVKARTSNADHVPKIKRRRVSNDTLSITHINESNTERNETESSNVRNANRCDIDTLETAQRNIPGAVALPTLFDVSSDAIVKQMEALAEDLFLKYTGLGAYNWFFAHGMTDEKTFFVTNGEMYPNGNPLDVIACERENGVTMEQLAWRKIDSAQFMWSLRGKLIEYFFPFKLLHRRYTTEGDGPSQRPRVEFEEDGENGCRRGDFYLGDQSKLYDFEGFAYNHDLLFRFGTGNGRTGFCFGRKNRQITFYDLQNSVKVVAQIGSKVTTEVWKKGDWSQFYYAVRGRSIKLIYGSRKDPHRGQ